MSAQGGVRILTCHQLSDCRFNWIPLESRTYMLKLKVKDRSLCLLQLYAPNAASEYQVFVNYVNDAFQRVESTESTIFLGDFNTHIGTDNTTWKSVIGRHGDPGFNKNGWYLLQLCCSNELCIMNNLFPTQRFHKCTWYRLSMAQKSLVGFCIVSSNLFSEVLNVRVKRGAALSTDHYLLVCPLQILKPWPNRKSCSSRVQCGLQDQKESLGGQRCEEIVCIKHSIEVATAFKGL